MAAAAVDSPRPGEEAEYQRLYARELQNEDALVVALMRRSEVCRHAPAPPTIQRRVLLTSGAAAAGSLR